MVSVSVCTLYVSKWEISETIPINHINASRTKWSAPGIKLDAQQVVSGEIGDVSNRYCTLLHKQGGPSI